MIIVMLGFVVSLFGVALALGVILENFDQRIKNLEKK
jgi:hypothetical protein